MSAPKTHDPLVVNTKDGSCWVRHALTRDGRALYALEGAPVGCPEQVLASLSDLAEHGIAGSADVLPVPVGPGPQADPIAAGRGLDLLALMDERAASVVSPCLAAVLDEAERLRARVAEAVAAVARLEQKRVELERIANAERARVAELEALVSTATEFRVWEPGYGLYVRRAPGASGFAILEARRTEQGRRAWTTAGLRYVAGLSDAELFCWPDAGAAVAEARRVLPGAVVREVEPAEVPVPDAMTRTFLSVASLREDVYESPLHRDYRTPHDLPETGGAR